MDGEGAPAAVLGRVGRDGQLRLAFERRGGRTVLAAAHSTLPLQVLRAMALDDPAAVVCVLNPTGGLVGGDHLAIDVTVGRGAHACLTTPSATKVYRTTGPPAVQSVTLRVHAGATLEWVPDHTIPFADSALVQTIDVELAEGARLILVDAFAAGRIARGEAWAFRLLESALRIRDGQGWLLMDRFRLEAPARGAALGATESHPYFGTVVVIGAGEDLAADLDRVTSAVDATQAAVCRLGRGGLVVRALAHTAPDLIAVGEAIWTTARLAILGRSPPALRKL